MAPEDFDARVAALYRREAGRLTALLTGIFGPDHLALAEDVVQESFIAALRVWRRDGLPDNPGAWLLTAARNRARDRFRRERLTFLGELGDEPDRRLQESPSEERIRDDQLRMIFLCCSERLKPESRIPLILKTLCGFDREAVARALLISPETVKKRLYRTRQQLAGVPFALPGPEALPAALATVHTVLYLMFNEGYLSAGGIPIRRELCGEAMALTRLLVEDDSLCDSHTVALLALMCLQAARLDARLDDEGRLVPLDRQDRNRWNRPLIARGMRFLGASTGMELRLAGRFHLEAAIAARHCQAVSFEDTDWGSICRLYDRLLDLEPAPLTRLNRAVAVSYRDGPEAAIPLVEELRAARPKNLGWALHAVLANLYTRAGVDEPARSHREQARARARSAHERGLFDAQLARFEGL